MCASKSEPLSGSHSNFLVKIIVIKLEKEATVCPQKARAMGDPGSYGECGQLWPQARVRDQHPVLRTGAQNKESKARYFCPG